MGSTSSEMSTEESQVRTAVKDRALKHFIFYALFSITLDDEEVSQCSIGSVMIVLVGFINVFLLICKFNANVVDFIGHWSVLEAIKSLESREL